MKQAIATIDFPILPKQTKLNRLARTRTGKPYMARRTPPEIKANAKAIGATLLEQITERFLEGPVCIEIDLNYSRRTGKYENCDLVIRELSADYWVEGRPDLDNIMKQLGDVLGQRLGVGIIRDDKQIAKIVIRRPRL